MTGPRIGGETEFHGPRIGDTVTIEVTGTLEAFTGERGMLVRLGNGQLIPGDRDQTVIVMRREQ